MDLNERSREWAQGFREGYEQAADGADLRCKGMTPLDWYVLGDGSPPGKVTLDTSIPWDLPLEEGRVFKIGDDEEPRCEITFEPAAPSLTPEELDRMRHYHATRLHVSPEYLAELGVGQDRWTRKDLAAVDAFTAQREARAEWRRNALALVVGLASGVAVGWALVGWVLAF